MTVSELEREKDSQTEGHPFEVFVDRINRNARRHFRRTYVPGVSRADTDCRLPWKSILATAKRRCDPLRVGIYCHTG